jgi:Cys-rich protein (TIGR01571 family)
MAAVRVCAFALLLSLADLVASTKALGATRHQEATDASAHASLWHKEEVAATMLSGLRHKALQLFDYVILKQPEDFEDDFPMPVGQGNPGPQGKSASSIAFDALIWVALSCAAALCFKKFVKMPAAADDSLADKASLTKHWSSGPFDCFSDMPICLWSCCCPAVRWAGTMEMVGLMGFWAAFALIISLEVLGMIPVLALVSLLIPFLLTYFRNQIRVAFEMPGANEFGTMCGDCVFVTCCTCCAISQEARHVQLAAEANHEVVASQRSMLEEAPAQAV